MTTRPGYPQVRELLNLHPVFMQSTAFLESPKVMTVRWTVTRLNLCPFEDPPGPLGRGRKRFELPARPVRDPFLVREPDEHEAVLSKR